MVRQGDGSASAEGKYKRKKKTSISSPFAGIKFGNWVFPPIEGAASGSFEVRLSYSAQGGKLSYEFPITKPEHPAVNRALIEYPLSSVIAIEVDYDAGALSVLLAAPPTTFLGQLPEAPPGQTVSTQFQAQQLDFSAGPVKTHRCHTLYFGPSGVGVPGSRGRNARIKAAAMTSWGGRGGPATPSAIARKFMTTLCQDEAVNDILEQERQTEPGGNFATQDIENSMRPVVVVDSSSKPAKARRRASAADALDDDDEDVVIPKKRKSYKPRANPGQQQSKNALDALGDHNFMLGENGFQQGQAGHQLQQNNFNLQDGIQEPSVIPAHTFSMVQNQISDTFMG